MTILLLKGYNNYFNRIRKQEADITTYKTASTSYLEYGEVNFDPNDGIVTELIVGSEGQQITTVVGTETNNASDSSFWLKSNAFLLLNINSPNLTLFILILLLNKL